LISEPGCRVTQVPPEHSQLKAREYEMADGNVDGTSTIQQGRLLCVQKEPRAGKTLVQEMEITSDREFRNCKVEMLLQQPTGLVVLPQDGFLWIGETTVTKVNWAGEEGRKVIFSSLAIRSAAQLRDGTIVLGGSGEGVPGCVVGITENGKRKFEILSNGEIQVVRPVFTLVGLGFESNNGQMHDLDTVENRVAEIKQQNGLSLRHAMNRLRGRGEAAGPAVSILITYLDHSEFQPIVREIMREIGPDVVPELLGALRNERAQVRAGAAECLQDYRQLGDRIVGHLVKALKDDNPDVRSAAARSLGYFPSEYQTSGPALMNSLKDSELQVQEASIWAIGKIGPIASDAVPQLIELFRGPQSRLRSVAAQAIARIGPKAEAAGAILAESLQNTSYLETWPDVFEALGRLGKSAVPAVPVLATIILDPQHQFRRASVKTLKELGPHAKEAIPALARALENDEDCVVREGAAEALGKMGAAGKDAMPALIRASNDQDEFVREAVKQAILLIRSSEER
jgi:HEAT repeat protein